MGYHDAISYLYELQKHGIKLGLDKSQWLMSLLGNPENSFRSVHVAGTNGKGSTAAITASLLKEMGMKVGLFTSPHLVSFTERIRVNDSEITEDEVVSLTDEIREKIKGSPSPNFAWCRASFFEFVTAMGFLYFKRKEVDWAVIETGMGGRLDATNVILPEVSVITSINYDHKEFLGHDLKAIAGEKAGIIKPCRPVITARQVSPVLDVISKKADEMKAPLYIEGRDFMVGLKGADSAGVTFDYISERLSIADIFLPLRGEYQAGNAAIAITALAIIKEAATKTFILEGMRNVRWPGRLESLTGRILIDGAHNPSAADALAGALKNSTLTRGRRLILIMGIMADKDISGILSPIMPLASEVIFTTPSSDRAAPAAELQRQAELLGYKSKTAPSVKDAIGMALALDGLIVITGSFYTIGEAKEAVGIQGFLRGLRE